MADSPDDFQPFESERPSVNSFDGEDFLFHLYRGSELLQDNCIAEAKEELERALAMQPRDIEGQGLLGVVYFRLGLYPRAIQIYEDIIRDCPREVSPRVNLALCYLKTGQSSQARDVLEEVIRIVPDHRRAWGYLGLVYERLGDHAKAQASFERAGQPHMARRMQQVIDDRSEQPTESTRSERAALRQVAAEAVQELEADDPLRTFSAARANEPPAAGLWRATEPGEELMPPSHALRAPSLIGRLGPAVPALAESLAPPSTRAPNWARAPSPSELAQQALLAFPDMAGLVQSVEGLVLVRVQQGFVARLDSLRVVLAETGHFKSTGVHRRARGKELPEPLGGLRGPFVLLEGSGNLLLGPCDGHRLIATELGSEFVYVREHQLVGFEAGVRHENGRFSSGTAEHVAMVQLSGRGSIVIEVRGVLRALDVRAERPILLRAEQILGWTGRLLPHPLAPEETPGAGHGFIGFTGDGAVFLELGG